jgi:lectin-like protein
VTPLERFAVVTRAISAALLALAVVLVVVAYPRTYSSYALTPVLSWTEAEAYANSLGGHLVVIHDQAEQDRLVAQFGGKEPFWIGLRAARSAGTFTWVNGDPLTYTNWLPHEPNNARGVESYGEMNWGGAGKWNDATNLPPGRGIIEFAADPRSRALLALAAILASTALWLALRRRVS